jgi:hypothetical protein
LFTLAFSCALNRAPNAFLFQLCLFLSKYLEVKC